MFKNYNNCDMTDMSRKHQHTVPERGVRKVGTRTSSTATAHATPLHALGKGKVPTPPGSPTASGSTAPAPPARALAANALSTASALPRAQAQPVPGRTRDAVLRLRQVPPGRRPAQQPPPQRSAHLGPSCVGFVGFQGRNAHVFWGSMRGRASQTTHQRCRDCYALHVGTDSQCAVLVATCSVPRQLRPHAMCGGLLPLRGRCRGAVLLLPAAGVRGRRQLAQRADRGHPGRHDAAAERLLNGCVAARVAPV